MSIFKQETKSKICFEKLKYLSDNKIFKYKTNSNCTFRNCV